MPAWTYIVVFLVPSGLMVVAAAVLFFRQPGWLPALALVGFVLAFAGQVTVNVLGASMVKELRYEDGTPAAAILKYQGIANWASNIALFGAWLGAVGLLLSLSSTRWPNKALERSRYG